MMSEKYFYVIEGKRNGPVSFDELRKLAKADTLKHQSKVWCRSMSQWEPAGSVAGLFEDLPPDLEQGHVPAFKPITPAKTTAPLARIAVEAIKPSTKISREATIIGIVAAVLLPISFAGLIRDFSTRSSQATTSPPPATATEGSVSPAITDSQQTPSPEAVRNDQENALRERQFEADVSLAKAQLEASGYNASAAATLAPQIVEKTRRTHAELEFQHGGRPSEQEIDDLVFAQRKVSNRLP